MYAASDVLIFSGTVTAPGEVIEGVSFTLVTVIDIALVTDNVPSETLRVTSYALFAPLSAGASKFGGT